MCWLLSPFCFALWWTIYRRPNTFFLKVGFALSQTPMLGCTQGKSSILMKENYLLTGKMKIHEIWDLAKSCQTGSHRWGSGLEFPRLALWLWTDPWVFGVSNPAWKIESWSEWNFGGPWVPTFCVCAFQSPVLVTLTLTFQSPMLVTLINAPVQISHTDAVSIYIVNTYS